MLKRYLARASTDYSEPAAAHLTDIGASFASLAQATVLGAANVGDHPNVPNPDYGSCPGSDAFEPSQDHEWPEHCREPAAYLGEVGERELTTISGGDVGRFLSQHDAAPTGEPITLDMVPPTRRKTERSGTARSITFAAPPVAGICFSGTLTRRRLRSKDIPSPRPKPASRWRSAGYGDAVRWLIDVLLQNCYRGAVGALRGGRKVGS